MMLKKWTFCLLFLCLSLTASAAEKTLKVGVSLGEPFTALQNGEYAGIAVDLWKKLAEDLDLKYQFVAMGEHIDDAVQQLSQGKIDALIGPIVPTYERMKLADFTQPYYLNQIGLIVPAKKIVFFNALASIFDGYITTALVILILFFAIYLHVYWYYEIHGRKGNKLGYWRGIVESFWLHSLDIDLGTIPTHIHTRQCRFVWLVLLAIFFSSVTASITSALTIALSQQYSSFNNVDDFKNRPVAAVINTAPYDIARNLGFKNMVAMDNREQAINALLSGAVAATVDYYPIASFYLTQHNLNHKLAASKLVLQRNTFSFAVPLNSPLRHPLDLKLRYTQEYGLIKLICENNFKAVKQDADNCEI